MNVEREAISARLLAETCIRVVEKTEPLLFEDWWSGVDGEYPSAESPAFSHGSVTYSWMALRIGGTDIYERYGFKRRLLGSRSKRLQDCLPLPARGVDLRVTGVRMLMLRAHEQPAGAPPPILIRIAARCFADDGPNLPVSRNPLVTTPATENLAVTPVIDLRPLVNWADFDSPHDWAAFVEDARATAFRLTRKLLTEAADIPGHLI